MLEAAQWQTPTPRGAEPADLLRVEMDAMRQPGAAGHPAGLLQQLDGPHAIHRQAEALLVLGFAEVGVQGTVENLGEARGLAHQFAVDRERRARGERDANLRAGSRVVKELQHAFAVGEDRVGFLHHRVGRQAAVLLGAVHRAAADRHADAERARLFDLDVDRVFEAGGIEIVMVGGGGAAREQQFDQREPRREAELARRQPRPDRIERGEPVKQLAIDRRRMGARQRLVEMMVGVDQPGQDDVARGVEDRIDRRCRLPAARDRFGDAAALDHHAALGRLREDR